MRGLEIGVNATFLVLGLAVCGLSFGLGILGSAGPESGFFPFLSGLAITSGAALLFVSPKNRVEEGAAFLPPDGSPGRVLLVLAIMTAMIAALPWLGFIVVGSAAMPLLLRAIGRPSWLFAILFGAAATASVFLVFDRLLGLQLPRGVLGM